MAQIKNTTINDTGFISLPTGTSAQRPSSPQQGMIRFNTDIGETEYYDGSVWRIISDTSVEATGGTIVDTEVGGIQYRVHMFKNTGNSTFTVTKGGEIEYLIVAGGGSGGNRHRGGGGAGGVLTGFTNVTPGAYTITVGAGAPGNATTTHPSAPGGQQGSNSVAFGLTAIGGGAASGSGGSAGGSNAGNGNRNNGFTPGQGNSGGFGTTSFSGEWSYCGGGGGGAGSPGEDAVNGSPAKAGNGGNGILSSISGVNAFYGGGGAGGIGINGYIGYGGLGGGGDGNHNDVGQGGAPNTGGGAGSGGFSGSTNWGNGGGGSGVVIVRYRKNLAVTTTPTLKLTNSVSGGVPFTAESPAPSARVITDMGLPNGWYWVDLVGPKYVYVNTEFDGGGWYLIIQNNKGNGGIGAVNYTDAIANNQIFRNGTAGDKLADFNVWTGMRLWETMGGGPGAGGQVAQIVYTQPTELNGPYTKRATWTYTGFSPRWGFQGAGNISTTSNNPGMYASHAVPGNNLTTHDRDQDSYSANCANLYGGHPWWFGACWSGNNWGSTTGSYQDAYFWVGAGTDYHNYGATYVRAL